ncbi:RNA polymerase sigma-70 factor, ECF subfamily [Ekhidna lutea]|uniref:RNA polymerase sigma-70 factor, ECF subfamily n=1 Tax=Ekhidna lutea TaxID=447679 RepID=A0A239FN34_EKHLU|nr:sigma-70 family RNA polymerase sigma factor [Ekhidna lutea]SNS57344.1 RNA polymerase sigma-70 factor, ECF subfamily [Ekhidna lutea]
MKDSLCEEHVFHKEYISHELKVRNFLFYKLGDLEKARDFTQEAFIRLWNNCAKVALNKAKGFLFTTANRLFLDHYDHKKVVLKFEHRSNRSENQMEQNPEFLYEEEEFKQRLETAVSDLPEKQRVVFLMSRIDKYKNREIAEIMDISIKTVEKHISSAVKTLKDNLDEIDNLKI